MTVTNEFELNDSDSVTVTVNPVQQIVKPIANAGPNQSVNSNDFVQFDGSSSVDSLGRILSYQWTQIGGQEVTLSNSTSFNPTFSASPMSSLIDYVFELVVTNEDGIESKPDSVTITVIPTNEPPPFEGIMDLGNNINIKSLELLEVFILK